MSLRARCRRARLRDFDRVRRPNAYPVEPEGWWIWNVHPFADEHDVLARLGMSPAMCREVDLYWRTRRDVFFVAIFGGSDSSAVRLGSRGPRDMLGVRCSIAAQQVTVVDALELLRELHDEGLPRRWCHRSRGSKHPPARV